MADLERLRAILAIQARVVVAFSGGADSAFLAWMARDCLGRDAVLAATAVSASLPQEELDSCRLLAQSWDLRWVGLETDELERPDYRSNDGDRCFHCKTALMDQLEPLAEAQNAVVLLGVNVDDLGDHRPGQRAAVDRGAQFPLVEAGFTKADVREHSRQLGLVTWNKPAAACLASRVPYGTEVTVGLLGQVERAERALRKLGFDELRVRHYGDTARIEVARERLGDLVAVADVAVAALRAVGYRYVTMDLDGLRSGNLNLALGDAASLAAGRR